MKLDRNTITLVLLLMLIVTVTDYKQPEKSDYLGIVSTILLTVALVLNVVNLWMKNRGEK
ncbi:hypothetical protein AAHH72_05620 [Bacillus cereus]